MILVVDTGIDDALALAFAVRHPRIQLEAVLTVAGNVGLDFVNDNTLRVLDWLGATDVPVVAGADRPLAGPACDATDFHGVDGLGGARLPPTTRRALEDAPGYLIKRLAAQPREISVVCTGPLTNLALALQREPRIVECVREVVFMGGAVGMPGNVTPVAEFNIYADPEAAAVVCSASWPLVMVGLDVTQQVRLTEQEVRALEGLSSPEAELIREVTRYSFGELGLHELALHDPLAVGVAVDPALVKAVSGPLHVETRGEYTRGQTVFDLRPRAPRVASNTRVCMEVDAERFQHMFLDSLGLRSR